MQFLAPCLSSRKKDNGNCKDCGDCLPIATPERPLKGDVDVLTATTPERLSTFRGDVDLEMPSVRLQFDSELAELKYQIAGMSQRMNQIAENSQGMSQFQSEIKNLILSGSRVPAWAAPSGPLSRHGS